MEKNIQEKFFKIATGETGITKEEMLGPGRQAESVRARIVFIALARRSLYSYNTIARILCKDHTTIIHSDKSKSNLPWVVSILEKNKAIDDEVKKVKMVKIKLSGKYGYLHHLFQGRCVVCGFDEVVEVHHVIPKHQGGTDDTSNLVLLCPNHHALADRGMLSVKEKVINMENELSP